MRANHAECENCLFFFFFFCFVVRKALKLLKLVIIFLFVVKKKKKSPANILQHVFKRYSLSSAICLKTNIQINKYRNYI